MFRSTGWVTQNIYKIKMSSVTVFVFLLDNLTGFRDSLNDTLIESSKYSHSNETPIMQNCDSITTDLILSAVSQNLDLVIVPSYRNDYNRLNSDNLKQQSVKIVNTTETSLHEVENVSDEAYGTVDVFDDGLNSYNRRDFDNIEQENTMKVVPKVLNETKIEFPMNAPFLVAIFETLANITAQTCAGTLLSPRWVLTAANCINILSNLYTNKPNMTDTSHYTIVAGSANPLLDGSVHNVTEVLLHPDSNSSQSAQKSVKIDGPYLALMRIEPEVEVAPMELMAEEAKSRDVIIYGWILSQNESDQDSLNRTSMSGLILNSADCQAMYSYKDNDVICLINTEMDKNITQLSSGGPVLIVHDKKVMMLAVVHTNEHVFLSYPLSRHLDWINHIINNK